MALDKVVAKKLGLCTSAFIRQAIIDKVSHNSKLKELEERIFKLENKYSCLIDLTKIIKKLSFIHF